MGSLGVFFFLLWLPVQQQSIRHSWLLSCCLVVVVGTDSKASSDLQTFDFGDVFWAVVRSPLVVERSDSRHKHLRPLHSLCNAFKKNESRFCWQLHRHWEILSAQCIHKS